MADGLVDTSSYPKPPPAVASPFDAASKYAGVARQVQDLQIGNQVISRNKMENANRALELLTHGLSTIGPNGSPDQYKALGQNLVDLGVVPKETLGNFISQIPTDQKDIPAFYNRITANALQHMEMINHFLGQNDTLDTGQTTQMIRRPTALGTQPYAVSPPIQKQVPPTTPTFNTTPGDNYGTPQLLGPQPAIAAPGAVTALPSAPTGRLPVAPPPAAIQPPHAVITPPANPAFATPPKAQDRVAAGTAVPGQPTGPATGMPPNYDTGRELYNKDLQYAAQARNDLVPLVQAYPLMKDALVGPGTESISKLLGVAKALGILPTSENDPVVLRQEIEKKVAQYIGQSPLSGRSDAAQFLKEAGTPNASKQLRPALLQLTRDQIGLDRAAISMPEVFAQKDKEGNFLKDQNGNPIPRNDYHNWNQERSKFPDTVDRRVFTLDLMEPKERDALLKDMDNKLTSKSANQRFEAQKFRRTLEIVDRQGLLNLHAGE